MGLDRIYSNWVLYKLVRKGYGMRRPIDSEYIRKKRTTRRPRDNWRRVKSKKMEKESTILYTGAALFLLWLCSMGILFSMVF